jgi:hypothetical protein
MPAPQNRQSFVEPQSGGSGSWIGKLFGGIGDNYRARSMAQLQLDLHEAKSGIDTREINNRTTHRVSAEGAGKAYLESHGYKEGLSYKKKHDRWNAKFAKDNVEDLKDNPIYVGVGEVSAKGVKQQKAATVRYPDRQETNTPTDGAKTETVTDTPPNTPPPSGGAGKKPAGKNPAGKKPTAATKPAKPTKPTKPTNVKKTSSGGGLTEVRNSNVETGNR